MNKNLTISKSRCRCPYCNNRMVVRSEPDDSGEVHWECDLGRLRWKCGVCGYEFKWKREEEK